MHSKFCSSDSEKRNRSAQLVALCTFLILVVVAVVAAIYTTNRNGAKLDAEISDETPLALQINGTAVTAGEFRYALNEVKTEAISACATHAQSDHNPDSGNRTDSIGAEFWRENSAQCAPETSPQPRSAAERAEIKLTTSYSVASQEFCAVATHPADFAVCKAIRLLEQQHAVYAQAVLGGQMQQGTWAELIANLQQKNAVNRSAAESGELVYGIHAYDLPIFVQQYLSQLKDEYINTDTAPEMNVSEAQIEAHYRANEWDFGSELTAENLDFTDKSAVQDLIRGSVKRDLRYKIYDDLLAAQVTAMELSIDRDSLVDFTKNTFGK